MVGNMINIKHILSSKKDILLRTMSDKIREGTAPPATTLHAVLVQEFVFLKEDTELLRVTKGKAVKMTEG